MDTDLIIVRMKDGEEYTIKVNVEIEAYGSEMESTTMTVTEDVPKENDGVVVPGEFVYRKGDEIMPLSEEIDKAIEDIKRQAKEDQGRADFEDAVDDGRIARPSWY